MSDPIEPVQILDMRTGFDVFKHTANPSLGPFHTVNVPPEATRRHIWIAADIFDASAFSATNPDWYLQAALRFMRNGQEVTNVPLLNGSKVVPGFKVNIYAPKTGSGPQPGLEAQAVDSVTGAFKKIDLPCFEFNVTCDQIVYDIIAIDRGSGNAARDICTGFIVLSMYP